MKFKIKRFLPYSRQFIDNDDIAKINKVLKSDFITQGPEIITFEKDFAKFTGSKYAVACSSGTSALHLCCLALGINKRHRIITSSITFVASSNCAEFVGAKVDFADIDNETFCISPVSLEKKLKKKKIDVVIVVHLCGHSSDMEKIYKLKKKYKFVLIEDACHGLGGKYKKFKIGSCKYSDLSTFSFHPVKPITTGEGGMVTTNNKDLYKKLLLYRTHGINKNPYYFKNQNMAFDKYQKPNKWYYEMIELGYNYRMTDIQACLGSSQLKKLNKFTKKRNFIANFYSKGLGKNKFIKIPHIQKGIYHSFHLYTILIDFKNINKTRNQVMRELQENSIGSQVLYIPVFLQPYYRKKYKFKLNEFPNSLKYYKEALSIPIFYDLKKKELKHIVSKLNKIISK